MWMWSTGINRNIVECKDHKLNNPLYQRIVLIETLWNVKRHEQHEQQTCVHGINRNIVECKVVSRRSLLTVSAIVLIETLWNVKKSIGKNVAAFYQY